MVLFMVMAVGMPYTAAHWRECQSAANRLSGRHSYRHTACNRSVRVHSNVCK